MSPRVVSVAIPYQIRPEDGQVQLLMVSSRKHPHRWIFPKGGWEEELGETLCGAAIREAGEEAGIVAAPIPHDTPPFFTKQDSAGKCLFHFFGLEVASLAPSWLEDKERTREWVAPDEARDRLAAWSIKKKFEIAEGLQLWREWWEREGKDAHASKLAGGK